MSELLPILITYDEIDNSRRNFFGWPEGTLEASLANLASKRAGKGINGAVSLLLNEAAAVVYHIDIGELARKIRADDEFAYKGVGALLGFNDHGGGSESGHKILVNDFGTANGQFVLYSPPTNHYEPTSTTFYQCDFTFMTSPPVARSFPKRTTSNILKTADAADHWGRNFHEFYLVGDQEVPAQFIDKFRDIGFGFSNGPISDDELERIEDTADSELVKASPYSPEGHWPYGDRLSAQPSGQFAQFIAKLQ